MHGEPFDKEIADGTLRKRAQSNQATLIRMECSAQFKDSRRFEKKCADIRLGWVAERHN